MTYESASVNQDIEDAVIIKVGNIDYIYFIKTANTKGIFRLKQTNIAGSWDDNFTGVKRTLTARVGNNLTILPYTTGKKFL